MRQLRSGLDEVERSLAAILAWEDVSCHTGDTLSESTAMLWYTRSVFSRQIFHVYVCSMSDSTIHWGDSNLRKGCCKVLP